jgi:hypothetical protein
MFGGLDEMQKFRAQMKLEEGRQEHGEGLDPMQQFKAEMKRKEQQQLDPMQQFKQEMKRQEGQLDPIQQFKQEMQRKEGQLDPMQQFKADMRRQEEQLDPIQQFKQEMKRKEQKQEENDSNSESRFARLFHDEPTPRPNGYPPHGQMPPDPRFNARPDGRPDIVRFLESQQRQGRPAPRMVSEEEILSSLMGGRVPPMEPRKHEPPAPGEMDRIMGMLARSSISPTQGVPPRPYPMHQRPPNMPPMDPHMMHGMPRPMFHQRPSHGGPPHGDPLQALLQNSIQAKQQIPFELLQAAAMNPNRKFYLC